MTHLSMWAGSVSDAEHGALELNPMAAETMLRSILSEDRGNLILPTVDWLCFPQSIDCWGFQGL